MERRGRIPVAKFRTQEGKTRSRSRVREPDYNEQDPETDLFTLLEDNIALKEENKALKLEIEENKKKQEDAQLEHSRMQDELDILRKQHKITEDQIKELNAKYNKANSERNVLDKLHKMKIEQINCLSSEMELLQKFQSLNKHSSGLQCSPTLKSKLGEILPTLHSSEMDSLVEVDSANNTTITKELIERLVDEFLLMKNAMNTVELQLYEANEKISELLENQHHLDEENITLRNENTNLTKVAKLLTENMKESVETSKKMEAALIKLKQRNDELAARAHDLTDGKPGSSPSPTTMKDNAEFEQIKEEVHNQNRDHGERIVEMKTLMEAAIQKNTNDELKTLQLRLEVLEEELRKAVARAEYAETELEKCKVHVGTESVYKAKPSVPPPPPPPPPPMPATLLYKPANAAASACNLATFSDSIASHNIHKGASGDKIIETVKQQVQPEAATGLDALMKEFKSGRVTLRRNRRKTNTNVALQEMFQVLEISSKQNRNSKICINMHL